MSRTRALAQAGLLALTAVSLSACITVFPEAKPAQLYRFDGGGSETPAEAGSLVGRVSVVRIRGGFSTGAATDRIMTVTGSQVAYLSEARWAQPAVTLFDEAVNRAFTHQVGPVRLVARGEPGRAAYALRLDVERFEAVYDRGADGAPDVRVQVHAVLVRSADRMVMKDQVISAHARASDNRVSTIVQGFEAATAQALGEIVTLTNENATPVS